MELHSPLRAVNLLANVNSQETQQLRSLTPNRVSTNQPLPQCAKCGILFEKACKLESHAKETGHRAWVCKVVNCEKGFTNRTAFSKHKSLHKDPGLRYPCLRCGFKFKWKHGLVEHQNIFGRCRPSNDDPVAPCDATRKNKRPDDQTQPLSANSILYGPYTTDFSTPQQSTSRRSTPQHSTPQQSKPQQPGSGPSLEPPIDYEWDQPSFTPINRTGFSTSSVCPSQDWDPTLAGLGLNNQIGHHDLFFKAIGSNYNIQHTSDSSFVPTQSRHLPEVTSFSPDQGRAGRKLFIYLNSPEDLQTPQSLFLTVMLGSKRCDCTLFKMASPDEGYFYALMAEVPSFDTTGSASTAVSLYLGMSEGGNASTMISVIEIGHFTYAEGTGLRASTRRFLARQHTTTSKMIYPGNAEGRLVNRSTSKIR